MEARRSQVLQKPSASKTQMIFTNKSFTKKTTSNVSLTPSQAAEQAKANARKNPLDALSRTAMRYPVMEKRSGLQDVDEEYLKKNVFARRNFQRHSGLNDVYGTNSQMVNPNSPSAQQIPMKTLSQNATESQMRMAGGAEAATSLSPSQAQLLAQQQQQHQQHEHAQGHGQGQPPQVQASQQAIQQQQQQQQQQAMMHQQQQKQMQQPHGGHHHLQMPAAGQVQMPCKNQSMKESHAPMHQQQLNIGMGMAGEPDMCTTCPNCQATIYLMRTPEMGIHDISAMAHSQQNAMRAAGGN